MKRWARRSKSLIIAFKIWHNWKLRRRFASGLIETSHGSTLRRKSLEQSIEYIDEQFGDYLRYGQLTNEDLCGKRILELGFGDNVGVALRFLAAGAAQVVCIDKFYSERDIERERELYAALRDRLSSKDKQQFDEAIDIGDGIKFNERKLRRINGLDLAVGADLLFEQAEVFDIVISRAVIEEVFEPKQIFAVVKRLLAPHGMMLHKIDMSDYGIFSEGGMHPLTFLTIPQSVYRLMASDSGIPNRKLIGYYREMLKELGFESKFLVTSVVGQGPVVPHKDLVEFDKKDYRFALPLISEIRSKLCREYRDLPDDELMVSGVFLVARKTNVSSELEVKSRSTLRAN
jgi:SAM-dependent methyltransferase